MPGFDPRRAVSDAEREHVAGLQRHELGDVGDQLRHAAHTLAGGELVGHHTIDFDAADERIRVGHVGRRHDARAERAEAITRLEARARPVVVGQRRADVADEQVARHMLHRTRGRHAASHRADDDAQRRAHLQRRHARRHAHDGAVGGQHVARLDFQHRRLRRRLVRRLVHRVAERGELRRVVQQRAIDRARQAPRRAVESDGRQRQLCLLTCEQCNH